MKRERGASDEPVFGLLVIPGTDCYSEPESHRNIHLEREATLPVNGPDFDKHELIPAIAQDFATGEVLMMAWMNREAWNETLANRRVCYFSRSRRKLWRKGEESGHVQELKAVFYDCDADTILLKINQVGDAACHTGYRSCFFTRIVPETGEAVVEGTQIFDPSEVYKK